MLTVKTKNGDNVTNTKEIITVNYVLEHTTDSYIADYGEKLYKYLQRTLNTTNKLDTICIYVYSDNEDTFSSEFLVVETNKQFFLIESPNKTTKLQFTTLSEIHNYVFNLMEN